MKLLLPILLLIICIKGFSQQKGIHIEGQIVDAKGNPIADAYIINYHNADKAISKSNGVFDIWVQANDSLIISHVSYIRKIIHVFDIMKDPAIRLDMDTQNVTQVNVSPNEKNDFERARENMAFLKEYEVPSFTKIKPETDPANELFIENNKIMRSEATSITIIRFSPSEQIGKLWRKITGKKQGKRK